MNKIGALLWEKKFEFFVAHQHMAIDGQQSIASCVVTCQTIATTLFVS